MGLSLLKPMLLSGARKIAEHKEVLNKINVFPIPDGDTGTNMCRTMSGLVRALEETGKRDLEESDFDGLYTGVLMASQGNSGVILSQWFKGFLANIRYASEIDAVSLNEAFLYAVESAYGAVVKPVEGTILTVARLAQENAEETLTEESTLTEYLTSFLHEAEAALENTPEQLKVLKTAGVVDSGGMGFVYLISGMLEAADGSFHMDDTDLQISETMGAAAEGPVTLNEFGYCTELIVQLNPGSRRNFSCKEAIRHLEDLGDSIVAVQDGRTIKIHVHTKLPEKVLAYFHGFGEFAKLKIENMTLQHHEMQKAAQKPLAIVAVAAGQAMAGIFQDMGADTALVRTPGRELSVQDVSDAVMRVNARQVILIPDDSNLLLMQSALKDACPKTDVIILPSSSAADVYAALSIADSELPLPRLLEMMKRSIHQNTTIQVKGSGDGQHYAARVHDGYTQVCDSLKQVLQMTLQKIENSAEKESVMVFCQDRRAMEEIETFRDVFLEYMPEAEVYLLEGGQAECLYIISIL